MAAKNSYPNPILRNPDYFQPSCNTELSKQDSQQQPFPAFDKRTCLDKATYSSMLRLGFLLIPALSRPDGSALVDRAIVGQIQPPHGQ